MDLPKIIIISLNHIDKYDLARNIIKIDDNFSIAKMFSTSEEEGYDYMDKDTLILSYKNNALFYVHSTDDKSTGITMDEYYNNNIILMNIEDFNILPENVLVNHNILIVWVDSECSKSSDIKNDMNEINILLKSIDSYNYLYFYKEPTSKIANIILKYIYSDEMTKNEIIENYR